MLSFPFWKWISSAHLEGPPRNRCFNSCDDDSLTEHIQVVINFATAQLAQLKALFVALKAA